MPQPTDSEFFQTMHDWSEQKLRLLTSYVDAATRILGSWRAPYYIDGFAGRGLYADGSRGSPLRIADLALQLETEGKSYAFRCINVEENDDHFANLARETARYGPLVQNFHGRFADHLDKILQTIAGHPAIFFLDPFGLKGIEWSALQKIIARRGSTDLWIRFDHNDARRLDGNFGVNDGKFRLLAEVFGISNLARLHTLLDVGATPAQRADQCLKLYQARLQQAFQQARGLGYADAYPIRSLEETYKYHMLFATAHNVGRILASNTVYTVEETFQKKVQDHRDLSQLATQPTLFAEYEPEQISEARFAATVKALCADLKQRFAGKRVSRSVLHAALLDTWFGKANTQHVSAALRQLKKDEIILEQSGILSHGKTLFTFRRLQ